MVAPKGNVAGQFPRTQRNTLPLPLGAIKVIHVGGFIWDEYESVQGGFEHSISENF